MMLTAASPILDPFGTRWCERPVLMNELSTSDADLSCTGSGVLTNSMDCRI